MNRYYAAVLPFVNPNAPKFVPNTPYSLYFKDVNFEAFVYKCASNNDPLYSCANAHGSWIHGMYLPLGSDGNTHYCCYVSKHTEEPDSGAVANRSASVSSAIINISVDLHRSQDFTEAMKQTVKNIKGICDSEICALFIVDKANETCELITENGSEPDYLNELASSMNRTPYETALAWEKDLARSDCLILDELSVIKERDKLWHDSLISYNISSIVFYAVRFNQELVGFIWAANFDSDKMMQIKETLELTTFFIGAVISNHQLLRQLEFMSMIDMLTYARNRNALNKRIDSLSSSNNNRPDKLGIVYADLNGLKTVNDNDGHEAGDKLLKHAAELLNETFEAYEIYRAGGDEFVVFCPDISEETLSERIIQLKKLAEDTADVSFAIGYGLFESDYDIINSMQLTDERMYDDKKEYYKLHPDKNRRK